MPSMTMKAKPKAAFGSRELEYAYDPPFEELLEYSDSSIEEHYHVLAPSVCEIISHQVLLKGMRRKGEEAAAVAAISATPQHRGTKRATSGCAWRRR